MASSCDFRVQCGRCEAPEEKDTCKKLWITWTVLYGVVGMGMIAQNISESMQNRPKLLIRVLNLWGLACSIRVVGGIILGTKSDEYFHPILMELLWHSVWLCGCFALTYFILALLDGFNHNSFKSASKHSEYSVAYYLHCNLYHRRSKRRLVRSKCSSSSSSSSLWKYM